MAGWEGGEGHGLIAPWIRQCRQMNEVNGLDTVFVQYVCVSVCVCVCGPVSNGKAIDSD